MAAAITYDLDGIVITEHNVLWSQEEIDELQGLFPQLVILRGIEVTTASSEHVLVFGITDPTLFTNRMDDAVLGQILKERQGAAILAHPYRYSDVVPQQTLELPLNAVEAASNNIREHMEPPTYALIERLGIPAAASSDAHWPENVGLYGVEFPTPITNEEELAQAVRAGEFDVFYDKRRIDTMNTALEKEISLAKRLWTQGYSNEEIRDAYGMSFSMLEALQVGRSVRYVKPRL